MVWTRNRIGRRDQARRQQLEVEMVEERCLLSIGGGTVAQKAAHSLGRHAAVQKLQTTQKTATPRAVRSTQSTASTATATPASSAVVEQVAGTLTPGAQSSFDPIIGAAQARATYGVDGKGMSVAVIDTGIDYLNPALGGRFGSGAKVVAGYNFASDTADPMATTSQHGTAVAGLIGSSDPDEPGVAPGVNLVALRVVGDNNTAQLSSIARALQWVIDHHDDYNITAVNMSLSDGGNYAQNWFAQDGGTGQRITELIGKLKDLKIPVIAATGNSFNGEQGEGFTSIVNGVISVTATDTSNQLLPDAQRLGTDMGGGSGTEIAAPGKGLLAPTGANQVATVDGTSFAAPLVTGTVVLLQQLYQSRFGTLPTVDQVTDWLERGADPINDSVTGITIGLLDVSGAAAQVPASPAPVVTTPTTPVRSTTPVVSYTPVVTTTPPAVAAQVLNPPVQANVPSAAASTSNTATASAGSSTTVVSNSSTVQVFVNGKAVDSSSGSASTLRSLTQGKFESLLRAMSAWGSQGSGGTSQVRIWNATSQPAGGIASGKAFPAGRVAIRASRSLRAANR